MYSLTLAVTEVDAVALDNVKSGEEMAVCVGMGWGVCGEEHDRKDA